MVLLLACAPGSLSFQTTDPPAVLDTGVRVEPVLLAWPLEPGGHVVTGYVDVDESEDARDYAGGTRSREGLERTEISLSSFAAMERGVPVLAAAPGEVLAYEEAQDDTNVACESEVENLVRIRHADGTEAIYGSLARDSVLVAVGEQVELGQPLARVGSSGCSTWPHLGFELRDADGGLLDPFGDQRWLAPPPYDVDFEVLEFFGDERVGQGEEATVHVALAGVSLGQVIELVAIDPDGEPLGRESRVVAAAAPLLVLEWPMTVGYTPGLWGLELYADEVLVEAQTVTVEESLTATAQGVWAGIPMGAVHWLLADQTASGCHPRAFDGYQVLGEVRFNLICGVDGGTLYADLSEEELSAFMEGLGDSGQHPTWLDSWPNAAGETRYAVLTRASSGLDYGWYAGVDEEDHVSQRDALVGEGFKPVAIERSGIEEVQIAALYDNLDVGEWHVEGDLGRADLATTDQAMLLAGLALVALDGYALDGETAFIGIWHEVLGPAPLSLHGLDREALSEALEDLSESSYEVGSVVGYSDGGEERFAVIWTP